MEDLKAPQISDKEFVVRFFGIFLGIGVLLVGMTWLRIVWKGDSQDWDRLMTLIGPLVAVVFFAFSIVPPGAWWVLLAMFGAWLFFGILQQTVRTAVREALRDRERR